LSQFGRENSSTATTMSSDFSTLQGVVGQYSLLCFRENAMENMCEELIIQRGIISIYNYLKYVIKHFDNGYGNFGTSISIDCSMEQIMEASLDASKKYKRYMKFLKSEELLNFEFLLFSLALMVRDKDPKTDGEFDDIGTDVVYPSYKLLVSAHEKKLDITFEEAMFIILSESEYFYNEKTNMSEREYFTQTYKILVKCLILKKM
jgi:hypothetical protein